MIDFTAYRNGNAIRGLAGRIASYRLQSLTLMEVCGGHTAAIHKYGLQQILPSWLKLLSGPGCPVCVSGQRFIDQAVELSKIPGMIITTYGDLIRVPGSISSLEKERSNGADVRIVYSVSESLRIAENNTGSHVVFLGVGFETTAPSSAFAVKEAVRKKLKNYSILSSHKIMPPALEMLASESSELFAFIAPGHVSAITGIKIYNPLAARYGKGVVVTGFEPTDIMQAIYMLVRQASLQRPAVENQYRRVVSPEGNKAARQILEDVFETRTDEWRGLGEIPGSGLGIRKQYSSADAEIQFDLSSIPDPEINESCICGEILKGKKAPHDCPLFGNACQPQTAVGACMVSSEGACSIYFKYNREP